LNGQNALCCRKDASFGAHCTHLNEDTLQRKKVSEKGFKGYAIIEGFGGKGFSVLYFNSNIIT